jgi:hypothetical protein
MSTKPVDFQSQIKLPVPATSDEEAVTKGQLDSVVAIHNNLVTAHNATSTPIASRIVMWDTNIKLSSSATIDTDSTDILTTKGYVDAVINNAKISWTII